MPRSSRTPATLTNALRCILLVVIAACIAACAATPAEPVPFKAVPAERILKQAPVEPGNGKLAVDLRRERSDDVIVRFRSAQVYVDGERVTDLMNGEHVTFYLTPGTHRLAVSTHRADAGRAIAYSGPVQRPNTAAQYRDTQPHAVKTHSKTVQRIALIRQIVSSTLTSPVLLTARAARAVRRQAMIRICL
jgi:hypothetical protein